MSRIFEKELHENSTMFPNGNVSQAISFLISDLILLILIVLEHREIPYIYIFKNKILFS